MKWGFILVTVYMGPLGPLLYILADKEPRPGEHEAFVKALWKHPMHIHGGPFQVVAVDGNTLQPLARYQADTVNVGPGQRYDVIWLARQPGKWLIHCHIGRHTTNNNVEVQGGGGLMVVIEVAPR